MTVAEYIALLSRIPEQDRIVCNQSADGVYLVRGEVRQESARWHDTDQYVFIEYRGDLYNDAEETELYGARHKVVVLR